MRCCNSHLQHLFFCLIYEQSRRNCCCRYRSHIPLVCSFISPLQFATLSHNSSKKDVDEYVNQSKKIINNMLLLWLDCAFASFYSAQAQILLCKISGRVARDCIDYVYYSYFSFFEKRGIIGERKTFLSFNQEKKFSSPLKKIKIFSNLSLTIYFFVVY